MTKIILSLFDYSGVWPKYYKEAGYNVIQYDLKLEAPFNKDVRLIQLNDLPEKIHGILAAPPCTNLASSGARWFEEKGEAGLLDGLSTVDAVLRIVMMTKPVWWALENPVGRLTRYLGKPVMYFQPYWYGDPYTKKTGLWGNFNKKLPENRVEPTQGSKMHLLPPSKDRVTIRNTTPEGFAKAFFLANP